MLNVDLYTVRFWLFAGLAFLLMVPLIRPEARKLVFALLNIAFIVVHCARGQKIRGPIAFLVFGLMAAWLTLWHLGKGRAKRALFMVALAVVTFLFVLHKTSAASSIMLALSISRVWTA